MAARPVSLRSLVVLCISLLPETALRLVTWRRDMDYLGRQQRVLKAIEGNKLDLLLVTHLANIRYLCGFTGSAGVLCMGGPRPVLFTDGRYTVQAREEVNGARVFIGKGSPLSVAASWIKQKRQARPGTPAVRNLGVEAEHMSVAQRDALRRLLPARLRLRATNGLVEQFRAVKEPEEIDRIRAAVQLGAKLLENAMAVARPGVAETAVAAEIEYAARQAGAERMSFPTIVAAGPRSALPHGQASAQPIPANGFVLMDFGVILAGYCSDMTRTIHVGRISGAARRVYEAVREAQQAAIDTVRAGITVETVDSAARRSLRRAGLARYFTHSTGHGVGLEIHERPRLARGGSEILQAGMVVTIEPGVYLPGEGGVRIEDMVVVTEHGCEVLTPVSKKLVSV